jgi:hypothetical protein
VTEQPIACSLSANDRELRAELIARLSADALVARRREGRSLVLGFLPGADVERRVREWAALEAECCPFLTMTVEAGDALLTLRIDGPPEAGSIIDAFLAHT